MTVRTYTLPGTDDERRRLVDELTVMVADVLGYPTRQANIARWWMMPMSELRQVHANWRRLVESRKRA